MDLQTAYANWAQSRILPIKKLRGYIGQLIKSIEAPAKTLDRLDTLSRPKGVKANRPNLGSSDGNQKEAYKAFVNVEQSIAIKFNFILSFYLIQI